ncbi:MAG: endolytic transglycosylase MltG [Holosporaceae bacterium]|nr:endolytic transglycosylase MltG [Holosporaceae bacterium]
MDSDYRRGTAPFLVGFATTILLISLFFIYYVHKKSSYVPEKNIIVERMDDGAFSQLLVDKKISDNLILAKITVKIMKILGYRAKFGEYALPHYVSLFEAIKVINSGKVVIHKITIPEGFSVFQVMKRLEENEDLRGKIENIPREGSIMPDTYCFKYPTTKQEIIFMAQKAMREFIQKEWPKRSSSCVLRNPNEVLTLASIVEKETNIEKEMVAGVYLKRLKINMKLQSCPTAIYAHKRGDRLGHGLKYSELTINDPYNTYIYGGLPPAPISNPGRASIIAVLHPEETDNLFFVFDGVKKHIFSKTYDEHRRNISKVRRLKLSEVR